MQGLPDLRSRFVPQIYQPEDYETVRELGFDDVIWSLYRFSGDDPSVPAWLGRMDLLGLAMPPERLQTGLARKARDATGVLTWAHRINTAAMLDAVFQAGAAEVLNDLVPSPVVRFEAISSGNESGDSFQRQLDGKSLPVKRGISLVALSSGQEPALLTSFDGCAGLDTGTPPDQGPFHRALAEALAQRMTLAIVVHDSAFCEGTALDPLFADTPLAMAPKVGFRQPCVRLIRSDGRVVEFAGPEGTRLRAILAVEDMR